jgi:hypothetical protein
MRPSPPHKPYKTFNGYIIICKDNFRQKIKSRFLQQHEIDELYNELKIDIYEGVYKVFHHEIIELGDGFNNYLCIDVCTNDIDPETFDPHIIQEISVTLKSQLNNLVKHIAKCRFI